MTLGYDITGLSSLRGRLKGGRARGVSLGAMLNGMANAMDWCARNVRGATLLLFDPQYVYANQRDDPLFVLLPIKGYARQDEQSPFLLLDALAEIRHVGKADPNERELARRLSEFVGGEGRAFSLNRFKSFVRTECPVARDVRTPRMPRDDNGPLCVLQDQRTGETYRLIGLHTYEMGRGQACDIRLEGCPKVSRRHVTICCLPDGVRLCDLGSTNGTFSKGKRLRARQVVTIPYGQTFLLSDREFVVERG
jgi:hypothetical protein